MERFHANVSAVKGALKQRPEVFHSVCMDFPIYISHGVVDNLMRVHLVQIAVRLQLVSVYRCTLFHILLDLAGQRSSFTSPNDLRLDATSPLQHAEHDGLVARAATMNLATLHVWMHVASLTTDERLIDLNLTGQLVETSGVEHQSESVTHEPRSLLGNTDGAGQLVTGDTVLTVDEHPESGHPLLNRYRAVFHDGPDLQAKLRPLVLFLALPAPDRFHVVDAIRSTMRTPDDSIRPAKLDQKVVAILVISEVSDSFEECLRFGRRHRHIILDSRVDSLEEKRLKGVRDERHRSCQNRQRARSNTTRAERNPSAVSDDSHEGVMKAEEVGVEPTSPCTGLLVFKTSWNSHFPSLPISSRKGQPVNYSPAGPLSHLGIGGPALHGSIELRGTLDSWLTGSSLLESPLSKRTIQMGGSSSTLSTLAASRKQSRKTRSIFSSSVKCHPTEYPKNTIVATTTTTPTPMSQRHLARVLMAASFDPDRNWSPGRMPSQNARTRGRALATFPVQVDGYCIEASGPVSGQYARS